MIDHCIVSMIDLARLNYDKKREGKRHPQDSR